MAKELSQEEVLDFLCQGGGKVPNASLLAHFKHYLRDPRAANDQLLKHREKFKRYVNSVAVVKQEGSVKYVVLRSRYRDLLGEELTPAKPGESERQDEPAEISNNRDNMGTNVLHASQVGGGWSSHTPGNGCAYHKGGPALADHYQLQGPTITLHDPDWTGNLNGNLHHRHSYTEPYSYDLEMRLKQPSSQSPSLSAYTDQESTSAPNKTMSPVNNTYLPNRNIFPHDSNEALHSCKTLSQQPNDICLSTMKTSSSLYETSIPSSNIHSSPSNNSIPINKISSSPNNASIPFTRTSSSPSNASIPFTRTSSSPSNVSIPFTRTSSSPSNVSIPFTRTSSSPSNVSIPYTRTSSSPSNASIPFTRTSSSPSNASIPSNELSSSSPNNTSIPFTRTSYSPNNASIPLTKSSSSLSNISTKTSEPPSNSSSPYNKDFYPADNLSAPFSKDSSFCSSAEAHSLPQSPFPGVMEHCTPPTGREGQTETTNPAFLNVSCRGQLEQKLGFTASTEILAPNIDSNGPQEVHSEQEDHSNYIKEQQRLGFYEELEASPPPSRYMNCAHPSSSLLPDCEPSITPLDVPLEYGQPASPCPSPPLPLYDVHDLWMCQMPVFKSIRCQLSLQDMEDFVDQDSCGSEGSDSGEGGDCDTEHKDDDFSSDSNADKYSQFIEQKCENPRRCPPNRKFLSLTEQYNKLESGDLLGPKDTLVEFGTETSVPAEPKNSPYIAKSFLTDQAPILFELAMHPPKHRASSRFQDIMSSSDDELIDRDFKKRRRPSRTKRPDLVVVPPRPDVDLLLTINPVTSNKFIVNNIPEPNDYEAQYIPKANVDILFKKSYNEKPSAVPLDPAEHDWIVKSACGSWLQVYGLFTQDPQLAFQKDFISGYTALHWFSKHGAIEMFNKFIAGAKKAGIELDFNIKSNGGYTPLHIAAIHGHHKVAAMLVETLKVNVKLRDNSGKRAWQYLNCNTSGEVWQLLGAPKGKTIFASRTLNNTFYVKTQNKSSQINRKASLAAFLKPQHQKWKANNHPQLIEREIYSD